jgi:hypothetical protein
MQHPPRHARPTPTENRTTANRTHVAKTLWPGQPGTAKLSRQYGDALLCVRYRRDSAGLRRYTTVELVVDRGPMTTRRAQQWLYPVLVNRADAHLIAQLRTGGAQWDPMTRTWYAPGKTIQRLGIEDRVWTEPRRSPRPK